VSESEDDDVKTLEGGESEEIETNSSTDFEMNRQKIIIKAT
jgi:hypothetical protein